VQLDEVHFTFFCDPALREALIARGDDISEDAQWAKLELIVETARAVWG
jgi:hypothetical protein